MPPGGCISRLTHLSPPLNAVVRRNHEGHDGETGDGGEEREDDGRDGSAGPVAAETRRDGSADPVAAETRRRPHGGGPELARATSVGSTSRTSRVWRPSTRCSSSSSAARPISGRGWLMVVSDMWWSAARKVLS